MHNLGVVDSKRAKTIKELSSILSINIEDLGRILDYNKAQGYVESITFPAGETAYYLTPKGIIKVCSCFS